MKIVKCALLVGACLAASGCVVHTHERGHPHRVTRTVAVLDAEHGKPDIVIVNIRPGRDRKCWDHGNHWHCRKF